MINALQEMCNAPDGKHINSLSRTLCSFLLSSYKDEGKNLNFFVLYSFSFYVDSFLVFLSGYLKLCIYPCGSRSSLGSLFEYSFSFFCYVSSL